MLKPKLWKIVILCEWLGFGAIVAMLWLDEWLDLPHLLFGKLLGVEATPANWAECFIETLLIVPMAAFVTMLTGWLMARVKYLEGFIRVCGYCRRVRDGDRWITLEEFIRTHSEAEFTGSCCRECLMTNVGGEKKK